MIITSRQVTLGMIAILVAASILLSLDNIHSNVEPFIQAINIFSGIFFCFLFWLTRRGWPHTSLIVVIFIVVIIGFTTNEPYLTKQASLTVLMPSIFAMVLTTPRWILSSAIATLLFVVLKSGWQSIYLETVNLLVYGIATICLMIGWLIANSASRRADLARSEAEQAARALQEANSSLEQRVAERTAEVETNLREIQSQAAEQARLLQEIAQQRELIRDLSVPVIPVSDTTMVMPLVGEMDTQRLEHIHAQALQSLERSHARTLIIDITGVPVVDTQIAQGLMSVSQAARLLGGKVILVGIRPEVAQTIVSLGMNIRGIATYGDLKAALVKNV